MDWDRLISATRLGMEDRSPGDPEGERSQFQRDYDRIIFSSPFRRMQNKTQVFPLPDRIFVHNRLTHSLEVASVGRSFGNLLSEFLIRERRTGNPELASGLGSVISAACLAHDMGNPPFGHSGESAISHFFKNGAGAEYLKEMSPPEQHDFIRFDGNANVFRLLTHQFSGKRPGGFALTYATLASIVKYPHESVGTTGSKFGFFQSEKEIYRKIAMRLGLEFSDAGFIKGTRHPLVYFTEAADDICYQVMDLEDACKLGILSYEEVKSLYLAFYDRLEDQKALGSIERTLQLVSDRNEQISYLRAGLIGKLIQSCFSVFIGNLTDIEAGVFKGSLIGHLPGTQKDAMQQVREVSVSSVYNHRSVVEIEIAGFKIINSLLAEFTGAAVHPKDSYSKKILSLFPEQYNPQNHSTYHNVQAAVDFISGMTDNFALDLYRKIQGISIPGIS